MLLSHYSLRGSDSPRVARLHNDLLVYMRTCSPATPSMAGLPQGSDSMGFLRLDHKGHSTSP